MAPQYIFQMQRLTKAFGPEKPILNDVTLAFYSGAKIGVLGPNGSGKSTVLRIMAGKEETSSGTAELAPGATVGLLEQEPDLDERPFTCGHRRPSAGAEHPACCARISDSRH